MELSAAVGFLRGIHFIKITARFRRGMAGRQRLINIARRHGVNNIGSLNLIIRKDSQHAACAAVIGGDDGCIDSLEVRKKPGGHWIIRDLMGLDLVGLASL